MKLIRGLWQRYTNWLKYWKFEIIVLILLFRVPALPRMAKFFVFFLLSYIFSPIDLIPDFIPMIGHIDDFMLIPITFYLIRKITPHHLIDGVRQNAIDNPDQPLFEGKGPKIAAISILIIWIGLTYYMFELFHGVDFLKQL